jgi:hypothetical protein
MNINDILNYTVLKIINDAELISIVDGMKAGKGPRKPKGWDECFMVYIPSNPRNEDTKIHTGTLSINYYLTNYPDGNANIKRHSEVLERLVELFDDVWPDIDGYKFSDWSVREPLGPLWDSNEPDEHFSTVRIRFTVLKIN